MQADPAAGADYSRLENTAFPKRRMETLNVAVVGAGALGNEAIKALALIGVGKVLVIDPDIVEPSNLTRSVFFSYYNSAGRHKADVIADVCGRLFPNTGFEAITAEVADVGFQDFESVDLLFSCVDSDLARLEIAYLSTKLDIPVADAGLGADNYSHGRVTWFGGRGAACFSCMLSRQTRREILSFSSVAARSCWAASPGGGEAWPGTPMISAVAAGIQVDLGLRALLGDGRGQAWTVELTLDPAPAMDRFVLQRSVSCPFHERVHTLVGPPAADGGVLGDLLQSVEGNDPVLVLDWPVCAAAACSACGHRWAPRQRLARFRRRAACPACGSTDVREEEVVRSLTRHSAWASAPVDALGLPARHLFTVRTGDTQ